MKLRDKKMLPKEVHSPADGRDLSRAIAQHKLSSLGIYIKQSTKLGASLIGMCGVIVIEVVGTGQIGHFYFAPIPGEEATTAFDTNIVLLGTLVCTTALHIAEVEKVKSRTLEAINRLAPKLAVLFIGGTSILLASTMAADISGVSNGDWGEAAPSFIATIIDGFNGTVLEPLSRQVFAFGFGALIFCSSFALSKLFKWSLDAVNNIIDKASFSRVIDDAIATIKSVRKAYRKKSGVYNAAVSRSEDDNKRAFALTLYQYCRAGISEAKRQTKLRNPEHFPDVNCVEEVDPVALKTFEKSCSFDAIIKALDEDSAKLTPKTCKDN